MFIFEDLKYNNNISIIKLNESLIFIKKKEDDIKFL